MDEVDKITQRAIAAADGILAQVLDEHEETLPIDVVRRLIGAGYSSGKQDGLAESRKVIEDLQAAVTSLLKSLGGI